MAKSIMIKKEKFYSFIWFVPVIAVCIAASLVYSVHFDKGPMITLILTSADGIEAGKTAIKARSVEIGKVKSISLASDLKSVIALVQMNEDTEYLLNEDTKFWIEKPRVDRKGVSGLSTILSGYYIELAPGSSTKLANKFTVLDDPPANMNADGLVLSLVSKSNKKITVGDTVRFKGMDAGMVITADYDFNNHNLVYSIVINPPFNKIVTNQSRFWISSGISVTMGAEGFHINTDSLESIISGGISFDTPNLGKGYYLTRASSGQTYTLYDNYDDISNTYDSEKELADAIIKKLGGRATTFIGVSGSNVEHRIAFEHKVLGCNGLYNSFSLGPRISFDTMPFGFENHLIIASINFRQDHMEKAIEMLSVSNYDKIVELIDRDEFTQDPIGAYREKIYSKNAPLKTAVIWNEKYVDRER